VPSWAWFVIWLLLSLLLAAMLALFAVTLFRKSLTIAAELGRLARLLEILDRAELIVAEQRADLAILARYAEVRSRNNRVRAESSLRSQSRHRDRVQRGRELLHIDATTEDWFPPHGHTARKISG
jgi:hypothetical protein